MKQPHTEGALEHTDGEQDTGNHRTPAAKAPTPVGTRIGAENVESAATGEGEAPSEASGPDEQLDDSVSVNGPTERDVARDERGRL